MKAQHKDTRHMSQALHNASLRRSAGAIRAGCSRLASRMGMPYAMGIQQRADIVQRMEAEAARWDNGNRAPWDTATLWELCADDNIADTVRYYQEQADNIMAEVVE